MDRVCLLLPLASFFLSYFGFSFLGFLEDIRFWSAPVLQEPFQWPSL